MMGDDERSLYEPYVFIGDEWEHVGEGVLFDAPRITGLEDIADVMLDATGSFYYSEYEWSSLVLTIREGWSYFRRARKALASSRRNSGTVKRHSHGRTQRTRRKR